MGLNSARYARAILLLSIAMIVDAQHIVFMQGINHPAAAPQFDQQEMAREMLMAGSETIEKKLVVEQPIPADTLIDPDGRVVIDPRHRKQRQEARRLEEERLIEAVANSEGKRRVNWQIWFLTMCGCACIVACGVAPAFILPINSGAFLQTREGRRKLNLLLSFAVGSLLGDVFLHLLPEVWIGYKGSVHSVGLWTTGGLLLCFLIEKCCTTTEDSQKRVCAIMNLVANLTDNFTHGLAVGGSFLVGAKFGMLTTFAIVVHELPHEISDFAILLRADFDKWSAVKAQLLTALGGIMGACVALSVHTGAIMGGAAQWILPFTAGGFLNIALAQILPELMHETNPRQNLLQLALLFGGILVMSALNQFH
uniref:Zinc transporter ZIP13 n=1 Tax=Ascaris suum TaxID=6253 RepID=F1L924_ASCSU